MKFEWDENKANANKVKHGVAFDEATTIFGDPLALTFSDTAHSENEARFLTFGCSSNGKYLIVSHTDINDKIRVISAREMTRKERYDYEHF